MAESSKDRGPDLPGLEFRCGDLRGNECDWQTTGNSEDEVLRKVRHHFRERHGFAFDLAIQTMVRRAIRKV